MKGIHLTKGKGDGKSVLELIRSLFLFKAYLIYFYFVLTSVDFCFLKTILTDGIVNALFGICRS